MFLKCTSQTLPQIHNSAMLLQTYETLATVRCIHFAGRTFTYRQFLSVPARSAQLPHSSADLKLSTRWRTLKRNLEGIQCNPPIVMLHTVISQL